MSSPWIIAAIFVAGLCFGGLIVGLLLWAQAKGQFAVEVANPALPEGVLHVLNATELPALVIDSSNTVVTASAAASILGLVAGNGTVAAELQPIVAAVRADGEPRNETVTLDRGGKSIGTETVLTAHVAPLGVRYTIVLANDLTDGVRLDAVRRDFLANLSHELKTPISATSLLAEAILEGADDPKTVRRFAKRVKKESNRLARITAGILELTKIQSSDLTKTSVLVGVDEIVSRAVEANASTADSRNVQVVVKRDKRGTVLGDPELLVSALKNLLENAIDYSPEGGTVGVGIRHHNGEVQISVTDQGEGIPIKDQVRIFERFYRVDPSRDRTTGGTGLGLSIVKHVAEIHGGRVDVWSRPGMGSTFTIVFLEPAAEIPISAA